MGGPIADRAEVVDVGTMPRPKRWCQTRLTHHPGRERVGGVGDPPGKSAAAVGRRAGCRLRCPPGLEHPAWVTGPAVFGLPRTKTIVLGRAVGHRGSAPGSRGARLDPPEGRFDRGMTEPNGRCPVEVEQAALDEPGEQSGPGSSASGVGQGAVGHAASDSVTARRYRSARVEGSRSDRLRAGPAPQQSRAWPAGLDRRGRHLRRRRIPSGPQPAGGPMSCRSCVVVSANSR